MAEYFNNYCVNIGSSLAEKISPNGIDPSMYIKDRNLRTIFISPVGEDEVETIIISLKISSPGCLHTSLNTFYQFILAKGIFPDNMKVAKVIPIYKGGNKTIVNNYRPISILSFF